MCSRTRHLDRDCKRRCWYGEHFVRSFRCIAKSVWSWCITAAQDFSNSICVRLSLSKYWKTRRYLPIKSFYQWTSKISINVNRVIETDKLKSCLHQRVGKGLLWQYFRSKEQLQGPINGILERNTIPPIKWQLWRTTSLGCTDCVSIRYTQFREIQRGCHRNPQRRHSDKAEKSQTYISLNSLHIRNSTQVIIDYSGMNIYKITIMSYWT